MHACRRDLKCENLFVSSDYQDDSQIKIGDLGLATLQQGLGAVGTPEYMAPEVWGECYDEKVDIYRCGVV